jgi:diguanylate cyclase (GGDEF)-like protein
MSRPQPTVLVVEPDPSVRRLLRLGLEIDGARVLETGSVAHACELLAHGPVAGVVVAAHLRDGLPAVLPDVAVVVTSLPEEESVAADHSGAPTVVRGDVDAVLSALDLPLEGPMGRPLTAVHLLDDEAEAVAGEWQELCQWDPLLGPDAGPPMATAVVRAVASALSRPQPLGWGPDPDIEQVAEVYAVSVGSVETAVGQFVCLREALRRRLAGQLPPDEEGETFDRLHMIVDRAIGVAVARIAQRLENQAYLDSLTGLLNRRALERDLRREIGRAVRYRRRFTVVLVDLDGLKAVNDHVGHAAGDIQLRLLARALEQALRVGDAAYRLGGDEFVIVLPETVEGELDAVLARVHAAGAPAFSFGAAQFPDDGADVDALLAAADRHLITAKASARR